MYKLLIFDIDGVFTDGNVIVDEAGKEYKSYHLTEADALMSLKRRGYKIAAITGENTPIVDIFREKISWDSFVSGIKDKVSGIKELEKQFQVKPCEICYIGDGKYDVLAIQYAGMGVAPANAIEEVKEVADVVLSGEGGRNCIYELSKILTSIERENEPKPSLPPQPFFRKLEETEKRLKERYRSALDKFSVPSRVCIITGGAGLMGRNHAEAILSGGGVPVLLDISDIALENAKEALLKKFPDGEVLPFKVDITDRMALEKVRDSLMEGYGHIDVLINNAANNPKMEAKTANMGATPFEKFPLSSWHDDIAVGLTGALLCSQVFGHQMAMQGKGVILNISSDLGVIAPDQRIYRKDGLKEEEQTVKPVTYSVIKHGLIGLTKYIATYWAEKGVRCNALCPAGIENGQDASFIQKLTNLVPMGRMASKDEYQSTVLYMISDASAYMTGTTVIVDGGRTCW